MTLKELKKMIAEEYTAYKRGLKEQPVGDMPMPTPPGGPGVVVSDDDVDATGGDAETTLKDIYDMLKDFFEGGDDDSNADADADAEEKEDVEGEEDEEADLEEKASMGYGDKGGSKKSAGANAGFKTVGKLSEARRVKRRAKMIAEARFKGRFQKLANIKK